MLKFRWCWTTGCPFHFSGKCCLRSTAPDLKTELLYIDIWSRKLQKWSFHLQTSWRSFFVWVAAFIVWLKKKSGDTDSLGHLNFMYCCTSVKTLGLLPNMQLSTSLWCTRVCKIACGSLDGLCSHQLLFNLAYLSRRWQLQERFVASLLLKHFCDGKVRWMWYSWVSARFWSLSFGVWVSCAACSAEQVPGTQPCANFWQMQLSMMTV